MYCTVLWSNHPHTVCEDTCLAVFHFGYSHMESRDIQEQSGQISDWFAANSPIERITVGRAKCENGQGGKRGQSGGWLINLCYLQPWRRDEWGGGQRQQHRNILPSRLPGAKRSSTFCSLRETYVSNAKLLPLIGYLFYFFTMPLFSPSLSAAATVLLWCSV